MKTPIMECLKRKRSTKDWCVIAALTLAVLLEFADAAFGLNGLASGANLAASNLVDVADVIAGGAAAWFMHG